MRRMSYRISKFQQMLVAGAVLAVFLLPAFTPEARASDPRWYVGVSVPVMFLDDSESVTSGTNPAPAPGAPQIPYRADATNAYDAGFKVSGMLGYEFGNGFRLQVEGFFARANLSKLTYSGVTTQPDPMGPEVSVPGMDTPVSGPADQMGGMVNVWYDFNEGSRWRPFIGGGLGAVQIDWGGVEYDTDALAGEAANYLQQAGWMQQVAMDPRIPTGTPCPPTICAGVPPGTVPELSGTDTVFAFKVGGGLGYELTNHITLQMSYRFFQTAQLEFTGRNAMTGATVKATTDMQGHLFEVGVRYRF